MDLALLLLAAGQRLRHRRELSIVFLEFRKGGKLSIRKLRHFTPARKLRREVRAPAARNHPERRVCQSRGKHCASSSLLVSVDPSFRALSGRLKFAVRRHSFNKDSLSERDACDSTGVMDDFRTTPHLRECTNTNRVPF